MSLQMCDCAVTIKIKTLSVRSFQSALANVFLQKLGKKCFRMSRDIFVR